MFLSHKEGVFNVRQKPLRIKAPDDRQCKIVYSQQSQLLTLLVFPVLDDVTLLQHHPIS